MSMSTHVVGYRPADSRWLKMKSIWDACREANIEPPKEVLKFFDHTYPGDAPGADVDISKATKAWCDESRQGFEVDLSKIPKDVGFLRFFNSF